MAELPQIPGYKILSKLAEGGMSAVYLGVQERLDRKVAIKILDPILLKTSECAARFDKEAKTAANLSHSNIIAIVDTGVIDNFHYIIMEYLEESLKERMKRDPHRKIDPDTAIEILKEIMKALDYAHFKGIYHRDIKPENIMFKQDNTPVLVDFGIARVFDSADNLTKTGIGMGTVYYMSPEQCNTMKDIDGRSDIYSLGVVLYEMLTGKRPYEGETPISVALRHLKEPIPKLPPELSAYQPIINKMMAKDREHRISNGAQFAELLNTIAPPSSLSNTVKVDFSDALHKTVPVQLNLEKSTITKDSIALKFTPEKKVKPLVWVLTAAAFLGMILLIIMFTAGKKPNVIKPTNETVNITSNQVAIDAENEAREAHFQKTFKLAQESIDDKKLENASQLLKELKIFKYDDQVKELEARIKLLNSEYKSYLKDAYSYVTQKEYVKAKMCIVKAKQINTTEELLNLEDSIDNKLDEKK